MAMHLTKEQKDDFIAAKNVTLDGKPANVTGRLLEYPVVKSADKEVEFSWLTIAYVINNKDGAFRS